VRKTPWGRHALLSSPAFAIPFLGILIGSVGLVGIGTGALALFESRRDLPERGISVQVEWEGAPSYVRIVLLECRADGVTLHEGREKTARFFPLERLSREVEAVRDLRERGVTQAGGALTRDQEWLYFKAVIERDHRFRDSLTLALHQIELANLKRERGTRREERYPVLLVTPGGLDSYEFATALIESTSRLPAVAEPVLPDWRFPQATEELLRARTAPAFSPVRKRQP
jgi:hypothetical protein